MANNRMYLKNTKTGNRYVKRSAVLKAINLVTEYEDAKHFQCDVIDTLRNEYGIDAVTAEHIAGLLIQSVTTAARDTKQEIRTAILAMEGIDTR